MPRYDFDAKLFTTISVTASDAEQAEKQANLILRRLNLKDPDNPDMSYSIDPEDGLEFVGTLEGQ